jgi:SET domain-containing protein
MTYEYKTTISESLIPGAGMGLFAMRDIRKGEVVTEYGGEVVDIKRAKELMAAGEDTHLLTVVSQHEALDGRVRPEAGFTLEYYYRNDLMGSFANSTDKPNVKYVERSRSHGRVHPYGAAASKCMVLRATRDIRAGEEIYSNYGKGYIRRHFNK